jgi:hypothetical protein
VDAEIAPDWPLETIGLPPGATPARLPDSILKGYMEPGELTEDGNALHLSFKDSHMDYWYVGFGSPASAEELKAHFDAGAVTANLEADRSVNESQNPGDLFQLLYHGQATGFSLRVYQDPQTPAGQPPLYVLFLQQL